MFLVYSIIFRHNEVHMVAPHFTTYIRVLLQPLLETGWQVVPLKGKHALTVTGTYPDGIELLAALIDPLHGMGLRYGDLPQMRRVVVGEA